MNRGIRQMLPKRTRKEYYVKVKDALHPYAKYIHGLLDALEEDHNEAVDKTLKEERGTNNGIQKRTAGQTQI